MKDLQRILLLALSSDDPLETLEKESATLSPDDRKKLAPIDRDGFIITSLLVRKLRFERACMGDASVREWFERDPEGFTKTFKAYGSEEPPVDYFPSDEARRFRAWCENNNIWNPSPPDRV